MIFFFLVLSKSYASHMRPILEYGTEMSGKNQNINYILIANFPFFLVKMQVTMLAD